MTLKSIQVDMKSQKNLQKIILYGENLYLNENVQLKQYGFDVRINEQNYEFIQFKFIPIFDKQTLLPVLSSIIMQLKDKGVEIYKQKDYYIQLITEDGKVTTIKE